MTNLRNLLYVLNPNSKVQRIIRRAVVMSLIAAIGQLIVDAPSVVSPVYASVVIGLLAGLDKFLRETL